MARDYSKGAQGNYQKAYVEKLLPVIRRTVFGWWTDVPYVNTTVV